MGIGFGYYAYFTGGEDFWDNRIFYLFTQNTFSVMNNDVLISIPLFLFMGYIDRVTPRDQTVKPVWMKAGKGDQNLLLAPRVICSVGLH